MNQKWPESIREIISQIGATDVEIPNELIEAAVKSFGGTLNNVVKTTTYVTSINYAGAVRKVREELYSNSNAPTSTLLVVAGLASPDFMVEIEAIAAVD